jgi:hypothetical protein
MTGKTDCPGTLRGSQTFVAFSVILAIASPFSTYLPWKFGPWPEVEFPIILLHATAALCALAMAVDSRRSMSDVFDALWSAPVLICAAIALWSAAMAPFADFPWLSIIGAPQTADGAILWLDIATLIAAARLCAATTSGRFAIVASLTGFALALPMLSFFPDTRPIWFNDYLAFLGLAVAVAIPTLATKPAQTVGPKHIALGVLVALPSFIVANNQSVILILPALCLPAYVLGLIVYQQPDRARILRALLIIGVIGIILGTPLLVSKIGATDAVKSIQSRERINTVLVTTLRDAPTTWLTGRGWGHTQRDFGASLSEADATMWDKSWDAPQRDIFHSHNAFFEALLSAGAPAAAGAALLVVCVALFSPVRTLALAGAFALGYAALSSLWFQLSMTIPATAIAFAAMSRRLDRPLPVSFSPTLVTVLLVLTCTVQIITGVKLFKFAVEVITVEAHAAPFNPKRSGSEVKCSEFPDDSWRGHVFLSHQLSRHSRDAKRGLPAPSNDSPVFHALGNYYCLSENRGLEQHSQTLLRIALVAQSEFAFQTRFAPLRDQYPFNGATWTRVANAYLKLAPKRTDVTLPYLAWLLQKEEIIQLDQYVHKILRLNPNDPVGLWFFGISTLSKGDPTHRKGAIEVLRKSIEFGIEKWMPVPAQVRVLLVDIQ